MDLLVIFLLNFEIPPTIRNDAKIKYKNTPVGFCCGLCIAGRKRTFVYKRPTINLTIYITEPSLPPTLLPPEPRPPPHIHEMDDNDTVFDGHDDSPENLERIRLEYRDKGIVVVKMLQEHQCDDAIAEQWTEIIEKQNWKDEHMIKVRGADGRILDRNIPFDKAEFLRIVTSPLTPALRKTFNAGFPMHRSFGACSDPQVCSLMSIVYILRIWSFTTTMRILSHRFSISRKCGQGAKTHTRTRSHVCYSGRRISGWTSTAGSFYSFT